MLEETREECEGRAAVACRIVVDELLGADGIGRAEIEELLGLVGELPDLWDFMAGFWEDDSITSRFGQEAWTEEHFRGLKRLTSKPVVGVGWLTSPDTMVRLVREEVLDLIGAARPSIADPFLPKKIEEGRLDDIRECIGCNVCVTGDWTMTPIRCTQNPSMGEEWRRGWHPERIRPQGSNDKVLVVGGGPAGLEAATMLGKRGYEVVLAEATRELGGRVIDEARLPGLAAWIRVVDYRRLQLAKLPNVTQALESRVEAGDVLELGFAHVAVATGARWRRDGAGRRHTHGLPLDPAMETFTPDDLLDGARPAGERVVLFDDDHYYLGGVLAEQLAGEGLAVTLVTPAPRVSEWTVNTMEQPRIHRRLVERGVVLETAHALQSVAGGAARIACVYTGRERELPCDAVVLVTARLPEDGLAEELQLRRPEWAAAGVRSVRAVGDALGARNDRYRSVGREALRRGSRRRAGRRRQVGDGAVPPGGCVAGSGGTVITWIVLALAIVAEVVGTTALRASDGMTRILPAVVVVVAYVISFVLLAVTLKHLTLGSTYAIWSGVGTLAVALIGWLAYQERLSAATIAGIGLIVAGVVVIHLGGGAHR